MSAAPQLSRRDRRAQAAAENRYRRQAGGAVIVHLFEAGESVEGREHADVVRRAINDFYHRPACRCFACSSDLNHQHPPAAFLVALPATGNPSKAALGVACRECWSKPLTDLELDAAAFLSRVVPGGRWLTPLEAS